MLSGALASENDAYKLLFDAAPDAILVVDANGIIRINNVEAERLLEAAPGELRGLNVDRLVPIAVRKNHSGLRQSFAEAPHRRPMGMGLSLKAVKLNGREFPVEISLAPARGSTGAEVIVMLRDVSERLQARRTERELVRANAIARISQLALRERSFDAVGEHAVTVAVDPLGADVVGLFRQPPGEEQLVCRSSAGPMAHRLAGTHIARPHTLLSGQILDSGVPVLVGDIATASMKVCPVMFSAESANASPIWWQAAGWPSVSWA